MRYLIYELSRIPAFVVALFRERRLDAIEKLLALQALAVGAWMLAPWDAFADIPGTETTIGLLPDWVWGLAFAVTGALHLRAFDRVNLHARRGWTSVLVVIWLMLLCGFLQIAPLSIAVPMFGFPVMAALWCYHAHTLNRFGAGSEADREP